MALTYIALSHFTYGGEIVSPGDTVDLTGLNSNEISRMLRRGLITADSGSEMSRREIDYAETTAGTVQNNSQANPVPIPGLTISVDADGQTPIMLEMWGIVGSNHIDTSGGLVIREGADLLCFGYGGSPAKSDSSFNASNTPIVLRRRLVPTEGVHTYVGWLYKIGTAAGVVQLSAFGPGPAFLRAVGVDTP